MTTPHKHTREAAIRRLARRRGITPTAAEKIIAKRGEAYLREYPEVKTCKS